MTATNSVSHATTASSPSGDADPPSHAAGVPRVVVALDESPAAQAALVWAAGYARMTAQPLAAVHVRQLGVVGVLDDQLAGGLGLVPGVGAPGSPAAMAACGVLSPEETGAPTDVDLLVVRDVFEAVDPLPTWTLDVVEAGPVGSAVVDHARGAALLVVGTGDHTAIDRLLSGSVSHYCVAHASSPVVTVRAPQPEQ